MDNRPSVVDLFCGAGGLSQGFKEAGYSVLCGVDSNKTFGETFINSHCDSVFLERPIELLLNNEIGHATGISKGQLDVLAGGPPCQGYSVYNHGRGEHDPRASLFKHYLRLVEELAPKWLVMENVTGLLSIANGRLMSQIIQEISNLGYNVRWQTLRSEDFGVPQLRRRIFIVANRTGAPIVFPERKFGTALQPFNTIGDAIGDLPLGNSRELNYVCEPQSAYQEKMRQGNALVLNHNGPKLGRLNLERVKHIPQGGSWRDVPIDLLPNGMRKAKRSDHTKRYGRPSMSDLSCTILSKCDIHWGAFIHPLEDRALTVREAARLQSFPDRYAFFGNMTEQFVQVGNAVPPLMASAVAMSILASESAAEKLAA